MEKRENPEVREFIVNYSADKLDSCPLFTKVFGEGFARRTLLQNVRTVYTNAKSKDSSGSYIGDVINIFKGEEDGPLLSVSDIENDEDLLEVSEHECIHAVLRKSDEECTAHNMEFGSGILEYYNNGTEIGRGFNEGLTNWVLKKTGIKATTYEILTACVDKVEMAIGEERTMRLGKGDIRGNAVKQLGMTEEETLSLLTYTDNIYVSMRRGRELKRIINALTNLENKEEIVSDEMRNQLAILLETDYLTYTNLIPENADYLMKNKSDTVQKEIDYITPRWKAEAERTYNNLYKFEDLIVGKYFLAEIEETIDSGEISITRAKRFDEINRMLSCNPKKELGENIGKFKEAYEKLTERITMSLIAEAKKEFQEGRLTGKKIDELEKLSNRGRFNIVDDEYEVDRVFLSEIAEMINPDKNRAVKELLCELTKNGRLDEIEEYEISTVNMEEEEIYVFSKNGKIMGYSNGAVTYNQCRSEITNDELDYTMDEDEDEKAVIEAFDEMRQSILENDPNAEFRIINRIIATYSEKGDSFYYIKSNQIVPIMMNNEETLKVNVASNKDNLLAVKKESIFAKIQRVIKEKVRAIFGKTNNDIKTIRQTKREGTSSTEFKKQIGDMSRYTEKVRRIS